MKFLLLGMFSLFLIACGGGGGSGGEVNINPGSNDATSNTGGSVEITGMVVDATTGLPLRDAIVKSVPVTEEDITGPDGLYILRANISESTEFRVTAEHIAYNEDHGNATLSVQQNTASVDLQLTQAVVGLVASPSTLVIPSEQSSAIFKLSSTVDMTGFSIIPTNPWMTVNVPSGTLSAGTTIPIRVTINRATASSSGELIINADNGTGSVFVNVIVSESVTPLVNDTTNTDTFNPVPAVSPVSENPGDTVDCTGKLPCSWLSADSALEFTVAYSDGFAAPPWRTLLGPGWPYTVGLVVKSNVSDAELIFKDGSFARSADRVILEVDRVFVPAEGYSSGYLPISASVQKNTTARVRHFFDKDISGSGLMPQIRFDVTANGASISPEFLNVPFGRARSLDIDCRMTLPCSWISADQQHSVVLTSAKPEVTSDDLVIEFDITTKAPLTEVTLGYNSVTTSAFGDDLTEFGTSGNMRGTLGSNRQWGEVSNLVEQGEVLLGDFRFRNEPVPDTTNALNRLQLHFYEDSGWIGAGWTPLWDPIWFNVPITRH